MRRTKSVAGVAVAVVAALALVVAGCGAGDQVGAKLAPSAVLQLAARNMQGAERAALEVSYDFAEPTIPDVKGTGRIDFAAGRMQFSLPLAGIAELSLVQDGTTVYLSLDGERWARIDVSALVSGIEAALSGAGANPAELLAYMADAGDVERVGTAKVDGAETDHYRARLTGEEAELFGETGMPGLVPGGDPFMSFDAFVDDDGLLRRMTVDFGAGGSAVFSAVVDIRDYGKAAPVDLPDPASVVATTSADDLMGGVLSAVQELLE